MSSGGDRSVGEACSWNWQCGNRACGRPFATDAKECCDTGSVCTFLGYDWCSGYGPGATCKHDCQCDPASTNGTCDLTLGGKCGCPKTGECTCYQGLTMCKDGCTDATTDADNCNGCDNKCAGRCVSSACVPPILEITNVTRILNSYKISFEIDMNVLGSYQIISYDAQHKESVLVDADFYRTNPTKFLFTTDLSIKSVKLVVLDYATGVKTESSLYFIQ